MTREEAINRIKERLSKEAWCTDETDIEALGEIIPELKESEDEKIRKQLINEVKEQINNIPAPDCCNSDDLKRLTILESWLAYLEKQKAKERYDRMAPIYEDKESFESALDKAWRFYNDSGSSTVDGCEDNAFELAFSKGFREGFLCREKQKEQKPIFRVGDAMRTWDEAEEGIKEGLPYVVSIDAEYYHCNNELICISEQNNYEFPPMNRKQPAEWHKEQEPITTSMPFNPDDPDDYEVVENGNATELRRKQKEQKLAFTWRRVEDVTTKRTDEGDCVTTEKILVKGLIDDEDYRIIDKDVMVNNNLLCIPVRELNVEQKPIELSDNFEIALEEFLMNADSSSQTFAEDVKKYANKLRGIVCKEQKPAEIDEYKIIKKHITEDSLSSEVNKRLKDCGWYVTYEKPAEWSEEDENYYDTIVRKLQVIGDDSGLTINQIDFLDKHRPQTHWKPNAPQMRALKEAVNEWKGYPGYTTIESLYNDLKKLI